MNPSCEPSLLGVNRSFKIAMAISVQNVRIVSLLVSALITCGSVHSQTFENGYYRLTNKWLGDGKSLDVVNDGTNSKIQLAESKRVTGQAWKLTPVGDGYYRLTTEWLGAERSLNVINAVKSGKYDKVERIGSGVERHYALTNEKEYFAELTEAYFGKNDYFPFTRAELVEFDPQGFELIQEAWQ